MTTDNAWTNSCLPLRQPITTAFSPWDDLRTDSQSGCSAFPGSTCGIFTSVSGSAPNRIFNIEWRAVYFTIPRPGQLRAEVVRERATNHFDVIYGTVPLGNSSSRQRECRRATCLFIRTFALVQALRLLAGKATRCQPARRYRVTRSRARSTAERVPSISICLWFPSVEPLESNAALAQCRESTRWW